MLERIERDAGVPDLTTILSAQLAPADLRSLLLYVLSAQAERRDPASLLAQYERDGSVKPAPCDARIMHALDGLALAAADGFEPVELAPVGPLGANAVLGRINQNNVLSTIRNTEVIADPDRARWRSSAQSGAALATRPSGCAPSAARCVCSRSTCPDTRRISDCSRSSVPAAVARSFPTKSPPTRACTWRCWIPCATTAPTTPTSP